MFVSTNLGFVKNVQYLIFRHLVTNIQLIQANISNSGFWLGSCLAVFSQNLQFCCHEHLCQIVAMPYQKYQVVSRFYIVEKSFQTVVSGLAAILLSCPNILSKHIQ